MSALLDAIRRFWYSIATRGEVADAPVYIPPSVAEQFKSITDEMGDVPSYEQLADLYLIPEETR